MVFDDLGTRQHLLDVSNHNRRGKHHEAISEHRARGGCCGFAAYRQRSSGDQRGSTQRRVRRRSLCQAVGQSGRRDSEVPMRLGRFDSPSAAVGYWIGIYDVTNSHYEWVIAEEDIDLPSWWSRNAKTTPELPNGLYKVVFFVRGSYEPTTNISEIELFLEVTNSMS